MPEPKKLLNISSLVSENLEHLPEELCNVMPCSGVEIRGNQIIVYMDLEPIPLLESTSN